MTPLKSKTQFFGFIIFGVNHAALKAVGYLGIVEASEEQDSGEHPRVPLEDFRAVRCGLYVGGQFGSGTAFAPIVQENFTLNSHRRWSWRSFLE